MRRLRRCLVAGTALAALAGGAVAQTAGQGAQGGPGDGAAVVTRPPQPASVRGRFSVVSVGDLMLAKPASQTADPAFQTVVALLKAGDVAIANQEGVAFDPRTLKAGIKGEGGLLSDAAMAQDYKAMGIDMVSVANNHSTDFGAEGLMDSLALLDQAGVVHAGGGANLQAARGAGFYDTPKGRVGLVSTASTFKFAANANDGAPEIPIPGAAGISVLHTRTVRLATADPFAAVRKLATTFASPLKPAPAPDARQITLGEEVYRLSDTPGLHYDMDVSDHAALLKAVREAKAQSDLVVFHIHAHESATGVDDDTPQPPDFLVTLFHEAVDAGADVIQGGGPHSLRGVEIYRGKVICYGLGMIFFKPRVTGAPGHLNPRYPDGGYPPEPDPRPHNPQAWYDSVVVVTDFDGGKVKQVRLYPIDLANAGQAGARGLPHLATGARAKEVLGRLQRDSAAFGTKIVIDGEMGVIRVS